MSFEDEIGKIPEDIQEFTKGSVKIGSVKIPKIALIGAAIGGVAFIAIRSRRNSGSSEPLMSNTGQTDELLSAIQGGSESGTPSNPIAFNPIDTGNEDTPIEKFSDYVPPDIALPSVRNDPNDYYNEGYSNYNGNYVLPDESYYDSQYQVANPNIPYLGITSQSNYQPNVVESVQPKQSSLQKAIQNISQPVLKGKQEPNNPQLKGLSKGSSSNQNLSTADRLVQGIYSGLSNLTNVKPVNTSVPVVKSVGGVNAFLGNYNAANLNAIQTPAPTASNPYNKITTYVAPKPSIVSNVKPPSTGGNLFTNVAGLTKGNNTSVSVAKPNPVPVNNSKSGSAGNGLISGISSKSQQPTTKTYSGNAKASILR